MALEQMTFNIAAIEDSVADGKNYLASQVFEVFNTGGTLASIFSNEAGTLPIVQDGVNNISNSDGEANFYIAEGVYYFEVNGKRRDFKAGFGGQLINDLSQTYNFDTVAAMKDSLIEFPDGKAIRTGGYYPGWASLKISTAASFIVKTAAQASIDGDVIDGFGNVLMASGKVGIIQDEEFAVAGQYGVDNSNDSDAVQAILDKITAGKVVGVDFGSSPVELEKAVTVRRERGVIKASKAKVTLTSNAAGFRVFGDSFELYGFHFLQSSNALFCEAIIYANDVMTPRTNYGFVHDCTSENVWRPLGFFFDDTIAGGASALRHTVRQCRFLNFHLQGAWANSFGVRFSGTTAGNGAGNDSVLDRVYCKGYLDNFNIENSVVTTLLSCSGDGAGSNIRYGAGSDNLRVIGGYYEFNQNWMNVVGAKFDLYLFYPNIAQTVGDIMTGAAISFISGGVPVGITFNGSVQNGSFITSEAGESEIFQQNNLKLYNGAGKVLRTTFNTAGDIIQNTGRLLTDTITGFTGTTTPLTIITGGNSGLILGKDGVGLVELARGSTNFRPTVDATTDFGEASFRVNTIHLVNAPSVTSDETFKTPLVDISEALKRVAAKIQIKSFKYLESIEAKGEQGARIHFGVGAQSVISAFESEGLDAFDYALIRTVKWNDEWEQPTETRLIEHENGTSSKVVIEVGEPVLKVKAGKRYEVVVDEVLALKLSTL